MPRLPSAPELAPVGFTPARGVTDIPVDPMGATLSKFGENLSTMAEKETAQLDELFAIQAMNQLRMKRIDMTVGQNGFNNLHGTQVTDTSVYDDYTRDFNSQVETLKATLKSSRAQRMFEKRAGEQVASFQTDLVRHLAGQKDVIGEQTYKSTNLVNQSEAAGDTSKLDAALLESQNNMVRRKRQLGIPDNSPINQQLMWETDGEVVRQAVKGALSRNDTPEATRILSNKNYTDKMSAAQLDDVAPTLRLKNAQAVGNTAALDAFSAVTKGVPDATGKLITQSAEAVTVEFTKQLKGDQDALNAAKATFNSLMHEHDVSQKKAGGDLYMEMRAAIATHPERAVALAQEMITRPEYRALAPDIRAEVGDHVYALAIQGSHEERSIKATERSIAGNERVVRRQEQADLQDQNMRIEYTKLLQDPTFPRKSVGELAYLLPKIGDKNLTMILNEQHRIVSDARNVKLDPVLLKMAMPEALQKATNESEKAQVATFNGAAELALLQFKEAHPGVIPTDEQMRGFANAGNRQMLVPGTLYGYNTLPAYKVDPQYADPGYIRYVDALRMRVPEKFKNGLPPNLYQGYLDYQKRIKK